MGPPNATAQCLIQASQANELDHSAFASLYRATYGMLLFATPHKGLLIDDIQKMLAGQDSHPRNELLQQIRAESKLLASQLANFKNLIRDRKVVSFYETKQTRQLELVCYLFLGRSQCAAYVFHRIANRAAGEGLVTS